MPIVPALRPILRLTGFALIATLTPALRAQSVSAAADGFDPNVDGNVYTLAIQPADGKILIGGKFGSLRPNGTTTAIGAGNLARLNPDGTVDTTFGASANDQVNVIVLQADGSILIGGKFTSVNGTTRNHVARLKPDGTLDAFDPNIVQWSTPIGDLYPTVYALAVDGSGGVLVGGDFSSVQPNGGAKVARSYLARFNSDGTLDAGFDPAPNSSVTAFGVQSDGQILVGGSFTMVSGTARTCLARLSASGALDPDYNPTPNAAVNTIVLQADGTAIIGGSFTTLTPNGTDTALTRSYLARVNPDGTVTSWGGTTDGPVGTVLNLPDGDYLVGGTFGSASSGGIPYAARLLPNGNSDNTFAPNPNFTVYAFAVQTDGSIVLAGGFTTLRGGGVNSVVRNHIARVSPLNALDTDFRPDVNGRLQTVVLQSDGKLLVGGTFTSVAGQTHNGIVRLESDGTVDSTFAADIPGLVNAILQQSDGKILVGGNFTRVDGVARPYLARLNPDGTLDTAFDPVPNGLVTSFAVQSDGKILVGGNYTTIKPHGATDTTARNYIARLNADGTLDTTFDPSATGIVDAIVLQSDGKILLGGSFASFLPNGATAYTTRFGLARINTDGTVDSAFNPNINGTVLAMALQGDGAVVFGGVFQQLAPDNATNPTVRYNVARVSADGKLDATFDPHVNGAVLSIAVQSDGKILLGGYYPSLQPNGGATVNAYALARVNSDGTVDSGFDVSLDQLPGNEVRALVFPDNNHIVIGGSFTQVTHGTDTVVNNRLVRVALDGSIDPGFRSDMATAAGAPIELLSTVSGDDVVIGGTFDSLAGTGGKNLAEFQPDGTPNTTFSPNVDGPVHTMAQLPNQGQTIDTQASGFAWLESTGRLHSGFAFPANVTVGSIQHIEVQSDGKLLMAGDFSIDQTPGDSTDAVTSVALARFNPDGSLDSTFTLLDYDKVNYTITIYSTLVQPDGKILVGGSFSAPIHSTLMSDLVRLNADGSLDTSFSPTPNSAVYTLALQSDNKILVGGAFTTMRPNSSSSPTTRNGIARLNPDGTLDTAFDPKTNNSVYSIKLKSDGKMLVGGAFTTFQPNGASTATTRSYLAELNSDGTLTAQDFGMDSTVVAFALQADGKMLVGGYFTNIEGTAHNYIARLNVDNTLDTAFNPNPNAGVPSIAVLSDGKIVIGGNFTALQPNSSTVYDPASATPRSHIARLNPDGTIDAAFNPNLDAGVNQVVAYPDDTIIVVGSFTTTQPTGSIVIGGTFGYINGVAVQNMALFSSDGSISSTFQPNPDGGVYALLPLTDGRLVVAGAFNTLSDATRHHIALFDTDNLLDPSFDPNANGDIYAVAVQTDGKLIVGGAFTAIGGGSSNYIARLKTDGTLDASFAALVPGVVRGIALQGDGHVLVLSDGAGVHSVLARYDASGNPDATFTAVNGGSDPINSFALLTDGRVVVGGGFTTIAGANHPYLARLTASGALDPTLTAAPNGAVTALAVQYDGKVLVAGNFNAIDGLPRNGFARLAAAAPPSESYALTADRSAAIWTRGGGSPEIYGAIAEVSNDAATWTSLGTGTRIAGTANWRFAGLDSSTGGGVYLRIHALVASASNTSAGQLESFGGFYVLPSPVIFSATAINASTGINFVYAIAATDQPSDFTATGLPPGLNFDPASGIVSGKPTQTGTFQVAIGANNSYGSGSATLTIIVTSTPTETLTGHLLDMSCLATVTNSRPLILGFFINGNEPKSMILRADGPALAAENVSDPLAQPHVTLHDQLAGRVLLDMTAWGGYQALADLFPVVGLQPLDPDSADSAAAVTLNPGVYTAVVTDAGNTANGGSVLAQLYDAGGGNQQFAAMSARGYVDASSLLIGGFVLTGTTPRQLLIRGVGPSLAVGDPLADPALAVFNQSGQMIAQNDDWQTPVSGGASGADLAAAAALVGDTPLEDGSKDAAVLVTLNPGIYTAHVTNSNSGSGGTALIEIYELP